MGDRLRAALLGVFAAIVTVTLHLSILQAWVGPFHVTWEWDHLAFLVIPVLMAAVVACTLLDIGDERAGRWLRERGVPDTDENRARARRWIRGTRTWRAIGFFGVTMLSSVAAWATNFGFLHESALQDRLVGIASARVPGLEGWSPSILGFAVGAVVAEGMRRRGDVARSGAARADLRPRDPAAYTRPLARWGPRVLAAAGLVAAGATHVAEVEVASGPSSAVLALATTLTIVATETARWAVVRHRQRAATAESVAFDDAARTTTLHAVSGSAIAIIGQAIGAHLHNATLDLTGMWRGLALGGALLSLTTLGIWLAYGVGMAWVVQRGPRPTPRPVRHES